MSDHRLPSPAERGDPRAKGDHRNIFSRIFHSWGDFSLLSECPVRSPSREGARQDLKTITVEKEHCSYSDLTDRKITPRRVIHVNASLEVETEILQLFKNRRRLRGFEPIDLLDLIVRKGLTHPHAFPHILTKQMSPERTFYPLH